MLEPGVFVPRRRTEFLVREALGVARTGQVIVDLCCGSGAVCARGTFSNVVFRFPGRVNLLVANAPYVPTGAIDTLPQEARLYEHHIALEGSRRSRYSPPDR